MDLSSVSVDTYFATVIERLPDAEPLSFLPVSVGAWQPERSRCHENVDHLVKCRPEFQPVRGWLIGGQPNAYLLTAHSVIREPQKGSLVDITLPDDARRGMSFVTHLGTEEEYAALRQRYAQYPFVNL